MKKNKLNDSVLLAKIQERIRWDIRVSNFDTFIKVKKGFVTLYGYFDKSYRQEAAMHIIATTDGIKGIENQSQVLIDYFRSDKDLEDLIVKQIRVLPLQIGEWIDVEVENGVVKLQGTVNSSWHKAFAARSAWELSGVVDCINLIVITKVQELSSLNPPPLALVKGSIEECPKNNVKNEFLKLLESL